MKRLARFIKEWQTVFLGGLVVMGVIVSYIDLPGNVSANTDEIKEVKEAVEENKDAVQQLAITVNKNVEIHTEQKQGIQKQIDLLVELVKQGNGQ